MATFTITPQAYGESQPLVPVLPIPVLSESVPGVNTRGVLGQVIIAAGTAYMLIGIIAGAAQWVSLGGADGDFNALVVTTTITAGGNITTTGGDLEAHGNIFADTGRIQATLGAMVAGTDVTAGESVYVQGDGGAPAAGVTGISNVVDDTQGAGIMTILSTNADAGNNTGFMKFYVGGVAVWVPYFADIAP